ncbi:hypothetical protein [Flavobacterium sp.]|jgi:hypothetical protein|uniref:hypothetical protein n=1 Tax=Flavobacterium sp. TaxID=239 RepID=UPI002A801249|nr:hypothetical protein [Flavobacterium sp.]
MGTEDKLYNKIKHAAENAEQKDFPGIDKIWARVEEKLDTNVAKKETSNWKKIAVAASIVLVGTIGYQFYTTTETVNKTTIVNETKIEPLELNEVLVETQENQIISSEEADVILDNQINKPASETVVATSPIKKKATIYPEEINIVNNDEIVTYIRADKKDKVVSKEEIELIPFGKNQQEELTSRGYFNAASTNIPKYTSTKGVKKEQFEANYSSINDDTTYQSKKLSPLVVIDGKVSNEKELRNINNTQLDSIIVLKEPLYIINGVQYSEQELFGPNPTSPYAPLTKQNIIKTVILQEADAEKEYGDKGKKGVVIITTKDGKPKK